MRDTRHLVLLGALALLAACSDSSGPANGHRVAIFTNTAYVDFDTTSSEAEASNMDASIRALGFPVTRFTSLTDTAWTRATQSGVVAVPEFEFNDRLYDSLPPASCTALVDFLDQGGTLITAVGNLPFVNSLLGLTILEESPAAASSAISVEAQGTSFAGGPLSVHTNAASDGLRESTLPQNALVVYSAPGYAQGSTSSAITVIPRGRGRVIVLGWDWYDAKPKGSQDGGWNEVLRRAIRF